MSSEFTFACKFWRVLYFPIFLMNLVDRELTEYQITQTLTLSRLHAQLEQDKGNQTVHTHATCWLEQTRGIRLFNHLLKQTGKPSVSTKRESMALANLRVQLAGLMSCTCRTMLATIGRTGEQRHTQPMRQLPYELGCWKTPYEPGCWKTPYEPGCWYMPYEPGCWYAPYEPGCWFSPYERGCWYTPYEPGCWDTPYVEIPVPQIVEEIAQDEKSLDQVQQ